MSGWPHIYAGAMSPRASLLGVLLLVVSSVGCGPTGGDPSADGGTTLDPDSSVVMERDASADAAALPTGDGGALLDGGVAPHATCDDVDPSATAPTVFWPRPVRAYPGIPFRYTMIAYDEDGDELCYGLDGAPAGMTIDGRGDIAWEPTVEDLGAHAFSIRITTQRGGRVVVPVSLEVTRDGFVFASLDGRAGATGTIDDPFDTIERGLAALRPSGAKTLIIRGGTWPVRWNWETGGRSSPTRGAYFSEAAPGEVYGYPGESVVIECQSNSHGLWLYDAEYMLARDIEIRGANVDERGGAVTDGEHLVFQRVTVRDSDWDASNNCSGFLLRGVEIVAHRCAAHDNFDRGHRGVAWNSANYLTYADTTPTPSIYVIDSDSSGSEVGFKIKHAGPGRVVFHGVREVGSTYGFGGIDDGLTVRFSTFVDNAIGIGLGIADPNRHTTAGDIVVEHNTVVNPTEAALHLQDGYLPSGPITITRNVFTVDQPFGAAEGAQWMYDVVRYTASPSLEELHFDENCLSAPSETGGFRVGRAYESWSEWRARGQDPSSVWGGPGFVGAGDYHLTASSVCRLVSGVVAGAYR